MAEVDRILQHALVVTMDKNYRIISDGAVALKADSIRAVGPTEEILQAYSPSEIVDCHGKALIPGLINAHTHVPMTLLRGLSDDQRLDVWLLGYMMPVEREFVTPEFCRLGTQIACAEMIRGGVTCFVDMYYFEDAVARATAEAGMRAICGQTVLKFPSPDAESYEDALELANQFVEDWVDDPLIIPAVAPHSAYTSTEEILDQCRNIALTHDVPLLIHVAETASEQHQWREEYEMPVVPWIKKLGLLDTKVIAAHCVHIDEGEMHTLEHANSGVAHNPSSNLKLASGFAPVHEMLTIGLNVGLGTDGTASNNDLDMFEEMRLASFIAKAVTNDPTTLPARTTFAMATSLGAKAAHIDHLTGSIEAGKRADLVLIELDTIHNSPSFAREENSIYSRLVYAAKSSDVTDVMVNGKWLLRERHLETIDERALLDQANEYAKKIDAFLIKREGSVLSKLIAIGEATQEESYEVQIKIRISDPSPITKFLESDVLEILRTAHYQEYDTYFIFEDHEQGRLRYREDEFVDPSGKVFNVRYRLTLTGPAAERTYPNYVLLSRSRFIAPAIHSLRFYREYFQPESEIEINKDRRRWLIQYHEDSFFINIDRINRPSLDGYFLEVKSRTWSRGDAEQKAERISEILTHMGIEKPVPVVDEYPDLLPTRSDPAE